MFSFFSVIRTVILILVKWLTAIRQEPKKPDIQSLAYKEIQELEPDLVDLQEKVKAADHIVVVYPNWWCTMPAILKGLFDRLWLPGFAFNFDKQTKKKIKRLEGKTGRVIIVMGTQSPLGTWWQFGDFTNEIQYGILEFAGIKTQVTAYGPTERVNDVTRSKWIKEVARLGQRCG